VSAKYNLFAGDDLGRLSALSDGLFSIAMTLLVLDLRAPAAESVRSEGDLWHGLLELAPRFVPYVMSFITLGIFWVGQQTQLKYLTRGDRNLAWIQLAFLFVVSLMPFTTALLAAFITFRVALLVYWLNVLLLGVALFASWTYAERAGLLDPQTPADVRGAVSRRIVIAQLLYAFGASLCVFNTYASIGFIVLVQLNYALAPRLGPLFKL
jgi:uncharacterized membrane protein